MEICSPEGTSSGFRISLVTAVKYIAYINFGCVDLCGLQVDIRGSWECAEIGKKNITRLEFRILNKTAINPQSVQNVIPLERQVFRGKYLEYILCLQTVLK